MSIANARPTVFSNVHVKGSLTVDGASIVNGEMDGDLTILTGHELEVADADGLIVGGKIVPQTMLVTFNIPAGATAADYDGVIPIPFAWRAVSVRERHQTAGTDAGSVGLMVKKVPSGTAKASGTDMLAAAINLKATANTNQSGTLHGTPANYTGAAGDGIGLVSSGTLTAVDGVSVTVELERV